MNSLPTKKHRVVFEQYVIPHYRVPFFRELSKHVDLLVVASENKEVDGLVDIKTNLPFKSVRLQAGKNPNLYHHDILKVIEDHSADTYISWGVSLKKVLSDKNSYKKLKNLNVKIMWMGCDGYDVKHFWFRSILNFAPWQIIRTIKDLLVMPKVDMYIAHSSHMRKYLNIVKYIPKKKITLTNNAIDTSILESAHAEMKKSGEKRDPDSIIFTGRLAPRKKAAVLVEAFSLISPEYPKTRLTIIGDGSEKERIRAIVQKKGLEEKVKILGGIYDDNVLAKYLCKSSLFVMPGLGGLGFNTAMATALPIIYTNADGTEDDIMINGHNGWYFDGSVKDLSEKMKVALSDPQKLALMGDRSADLIKNKFSLENMVKGYLKAISS